MTPERKLELLKHWADAWRNEKAKLREAEEAVQKLRKSLCYEESRVIALTRNVESYARDLFNAALEDT